MAWLCAGKLAACEAHLWLVVQHKLIVANDGSRLPRATHAGSTYPRESPSALPGLRSKRIVASGTGGDCRAGLTDRVRFFLTTLPAGYTMVSAITIRRLGHIIAKRLRVIPTVLFVAKQLARGEDYVDT